MKTLRLATVCLLAVLASGHAYAAEIPPHTGVDLYGVQAYSDVGPGSVVAGDEITFYVSNTFAYDAAIYRLGSDPKSMAGDELIASLGSFGANPQAIHPGSYVHVENRIRGELTGLTIETWFQAAPYVGGWRGVMTQYASFYEEGFGLFLCDDKVAFYLGVGRDNLSTTSRAVIIPNMWHHLVATWDGNEKAIWVNGEKVGSWPFSGPANAGKEPLRLAAYGHNGKAGLFLNGTLATPAIYNRALSAQEIQSRYTAVTIQPPTGSHVLASWPFDEENGEVVRDVSGNNRNGRIINHGIWQVGGPRFNADVPRFGYDPATDQTRGHGLRFADDQLVDCGWEPTITWQIPITAKSGLYVLRLQFQWGGTSYYHVPFIVRRTSWQKRAPIAVVASTHTWWAYNSVSFPRPLHGYEHVVADFVPQRNTESTSFYRDHASVVPSYYVGLRMPNPYADPYLSWGEGDGVSHLLPVERLLHVWLEKQGYDFEIITDLDLHRNPSILAGRKVMILVGHNEYWSIPMYQNIEQYLNRGGNMLVMNGNTGFWRVSFDEDLLVMEGRKVAPGAGARVPYNRLGERYHEQDGLAGGLTRETGIPAWRLTGLETIGWVEHKSEQFGPLVVSSVDHPLFAGTGISAGDTLAYGAGGHEVDALLPTIFSVGGSPGLALSAFPQAPASGVTLLGHFTTRRPDLGVTILDWWANRSNAATSVASDVILWQRPEGGEVFNFGSIRSAVGFADERFGKLVANVLKRFGAEPARGLPLVYALPADFNSDGIVDFADFFHFAENFGKRVEDGIHEACDINSDGIVDFDDFVIFAQYFGQRGGAAKPAAALTLPEILSNNPKLRQLAESHRLIGPALARYLATLPKFALLQNFPNPFNPETTIRYSLAEPALVDVSIYSASGQLVRTLVAEEKTVGAHAVMWDGTDSFGRRVASGLYLYRITAGSFTDVKRMLLLK